MRLKYSWHATGGIDIVHFNQIAPISIADRNVILTHKLDTIFEDYRKMSGDRAQCIRVFMSR